MKNAGYKIIRRFEYAEKYEFVIGRSEKDPENYVTWDHEKGTDYYFWGHYFVTEKDALRDIIRRMQNEIE